MFDESCRIRGFDDELADAIDAELRRQQEAIDAEQRRIELPETGVMLSQVLADRLHVRPGDSVDVEVLELPHAEGLWDPEGEPDPEDA